MRRKQTTAPKKTALANRYDLNLEYLPNFRIFEVKYMGATNYSGSRIKIIDHRFRESVTIPYNYEMRDTIEGAQFYLQSLGIPIMGQGEYKDGASTILFSSDFGISIKKRK